MVIMEELPQRTYTLYLNSNVGFPGLVRTNPNNNVSWLIDWDSLFSRENYKYKNCRVRYKLVGETNTTATQATDNCLGLLVANFGQSFSGKNTSYLVLGAIDQIHTQSLATATWTNTGTAMTSETMTYAHGQQIDVPYGLKELTLQMWKVGYGAVGDTDNVLIDNNSNSQYFIIFQFELY